MILNTSISGGGAKLNGIKGNYLATADVAKGDFVQLTTWGVEEPKLDEVLSWTVNSTTYIKNASVAVLSPTQIIVVWHTGKNSSTSSDTSVYAQVVTYKNAAWAAGTALLLTTAKTSYADIGVGRLTDSRAAVFVNSASALNKILVLDVSENGEITVAAEADPTWTTSSSTKLAAHVVPLTPTKFVVAGSYGVATATASVCTYVDGVLSVSARTDIADAKDDDDCALRITKLNDDAILVVHHYRHESSASTTLVEYIRVHGVSDTQVSNYTASANMKDLNVDFNSTATGFIYWENNKILAARVVNTTGLFMAFITFDSTTNSINVGEPMTISASAGTLYTITKLSDNKVCIWRYKNGHFLDVYDIVTGDVTSNANSMFATTTTSGQLGKLTDAAFGWYALLEGSSKLWIAPCISQTTAAPYVTRLDGVATKGATAGQKVEVVTPE